MTGPWQILRSLVEAKSASDYKNDLLKLITRRYGEHEADEVMASMRSLGGFKAFKDHMATKYMSSDIDKIIKDMGQAAQAAHAKRNPPAHSKKDEPDVQGAARGSSGKQYVPPDVAADKQARIDQMRAARQGAGAGGSDAAKALMTPGTKQTHAVGTAGQHQTKTQPSVAAGIAPQQNQGPKSGLVGAQRKVDKLTKEKGTKEGDRLAASLGVPTTAERTVTDPDSGESRVQIWSPDRVLKFMDADAQAVPGATPDSPAKSMSGASPRQKPAEPMSRTDMIKMGAIQRNAAAPADKLGPNRPPSFDGEVWQPHGREGEKLVSRPDMATGNWQRSMMPVNPKHTGQKLVGLDGKWVLPSVYAAQKGTDAGKSGSTAKPYTRGASPDVKAAADRSADVDLMRKVAGSPRMQQQMRALAKQRGIELPDDDDDEYPASQGWRKAD